MPLAKTIRTPAIEPHIQAISGVLHRLVESQQQIATTQYVDTLAEQTVLEELLESSKPEHTKNVSGYHYLLKTPFRYPPLKWGSRFGRKTEPSIFYGGLNVETTLAESAYYRFVFWHSIDAPAIKPNIQSQHTLFSARYSTNKGIKLYEKPFSSKRTLLTHKENYSHTQAIGTRMRECNVIAFEYESARATATKNAKNYCIGIFRIEGLKDKKPGSQSSWICELTATHVSFKQSHSSQLMQFPLSNFLIDGYFPMPA